MNDVAGSSEPISFFDRASVRIVLAVLGLAIFGYTLRDFDHDGFLRLLENLGPAIGLIFVPHALSSLLHTFGFRSFVLGVPSVAAKPPRWLLAKLHAIVLASEAARMALPAGIVVAESVSLVGLRSNVRMRTPEALALLGIKKAWHLAAHSVWMVLLVAVGWRELRVLGRGLHEPWLPVIAAFLVTSALVITAVTTLALITSARAAHGFTRMSAKIPIRRVRTWAETRLRERRSRETIHLPRRAHLVGALFFLAQWAALVLETFVLLRLLGVPIDFTQALTLEMGVVMIRALAFAIPGQVGIQDAGYVTILEALGVGGATELAVFFVLLRRGKEAFFCVVGFVLAGIARRSS